MDRKQVEKDLKFLKNDKKVLAVLLFGSQVTGKTHERSDTDICIVAPDTKPIKIMRKVWRRLKTEKYDIHTFEEFSLKMKNQVMKDHEIIRCEDEQELEEYFYRYRKIWNDQAIARGVT
ncbi:MAG: DNA polymerase subunit beta [Nanohaloarchaea archaeon SW_7_43_1]|nr:MAG: DNA polymerase subunit beta [Nanohaloarchaea archaeon SW_7_43_1]